MNNNSRPGVPASQAVVRAQMIALLYAHARTANIFVVILGLTTVFFFWEDNLRIWLISWFSVLCASSLLRHALAVFYHRVNPSVKEAPRWGSYYTLMTGIVGVLWGGFISAVLLFLPPDPMGAAFVIVLYAGYTAAAVTSLASHLPAVYVFIVPLAVTLIGGMLSRPDKLHLFYAICGILFFAHNALCARNTNRSIAEAVALRFENERLVDALTEKNQQAEQARELAEQSREQAEHANTAKSKFLAAASHDLRQPLQALTFLHFALKKYVVGDKAQELINSMKISLDALNGLFTALLDISRLDAGVISPEINDFKLQDIIKRLRNDFEPEAKAKGLRLRCESEGLSVRSDPQLLERILRNFLSNAMRYTERGEVALCCEVKDDVVCIRVSDTGKGIPREKHQEIFREFYQLENPERDRSKGLGLGLAIVDRLARLLDHPVGVESEPGRGSVFSISVPIAEAAAYTPPAYALAADVVDLSGLLVLVLDDEYSVRLSTATLLQDWGCECLLAGSEDEAVEQLRHRKRMPDAVIADYRLREERTGAQAVRRIQQEYGIAIPALIITGDTAPDRLREATKSGYQLLHKPVSPEQLYLFLRDVRMQRLRGGVADMAAES